MRHVALVSCTCRRCGASWHPRAIEVLRCAKCRSPYWDRPRSGEEEISHEHKPDLTIAELRNRIRAKAK